MIGSTNGEILTQYSKKKRANEDKTTMNVYLDLGWTCPVTGEESRSTNGECVYIWRQMTTDCNNSSSQTRLGQSLSINNKNSSSYFKESTQNRSIGVLPDTIDSFIYRTPNLTEYERPYPVIIN